jgi:hypothetical protein
MVRDARHTQVFWRLVARALRRGTAALPRAVM